MPHPMALALLPLRQAALWARSVAPPTVPAWLLAVGAVVAGYLAGRLGSGILAAAARAVLLAAGCVIAYYVLRVA